MTTTVKAKVRAGWLVSTASSSAAPAKRSRSSGALRHQDDRPGAPRNTSPRHRAGGPGRPSKQVVADDVDVSVTTVRRKEAGLLLLRRNGV